MQDDYKYFGRIEIRGRGMTVQGWSKDPMALDDVSYELPDVTVNIGDKISIGDIRMTVTSISHCFSKDEGHAYEGKYVYCDIDEPRSGKE